MEFKNILLQKESHVATLVFNRPDKMNTISMEMREEIVAALGQVNEDDDARVLVLTGAGDRAFCAGVDVGVMSDRIAGKVEEPSRRKITQRIGWHIPKIRELRTPTIAAINGVAAGMGVSFITACDIRIASDKSRYTCAWVNRGLVPDGGVTYLLPQIVGIEKALEMFYTGEVIDAQEALRIRLVGRVVPHDELMKVVKELAEKIAAGPPVAHEMAKCGVYRGLESDIKGALDFESYAVKVCTATEDFKEGVKSFMEKRKPDFQGR